MHVLAAVAGLVAAGLVGSGPSAPSGPLALTASGAVSTAYEWAAVTTSYAHASATQAVNIEITASRLNGVQVRPGQVFSYYARVGPYTAENGYGWGRAFYGDRIVPSVGGGVCQGASTLYAAVLRSGMKVLERHQHGLTVPYLPPGEDATVAGDFLNFRFQNNTPGAVVIRASASARRYRLSLWGTVPGPRITVHHQVLATYPFRTIERVDPMLPRGTTRVLAPGQSGVKVRTWVVEETPLGPVTRDLGVDIYRASPRIVITGPGSGAQTAALVGGPPEGARC
ncbi:MAG: VanW family protein [Thermaerobacter sp.]|nr:VanW family protein [Thermaerobacter sp.]